MFNKHVQIRPASHHILHRFGQQPNNFHLHEHSRLQRDDHEKLLNLQLSFLTPIL